MSKGKMASDGACLLQTTSLQSPLGLLQLSGCEAGVHSVHITPCTPALRPDHASVRCELSAGQQAANPELQRCVDWLQTYFTEPRATLTLPLPALHHPMLLGDSFSARVLWTLLRRVKVGETVSYKTLAELAGNPKAVRAVGGAMRRNPIPLLIPCHRVLPSGGQSGRYMGGKGDHLKVWLLDRERE